MMRRAGWFFVFVLAFLILVAEVQRHDEMVDITLIAQ
jgi:hypothetical protein